MSLTVKKIPTTYLFILRQLMYYVYLKNKLFLILYFPNKRNIRRNLIERLPQKIVNNIVFDMNHLWSYCYIMFIHSDV